MRGRGDSGRKLNESYGVANIILYNHGGAGSASKGNTIRGKSVAVYGNAVSVSIRAS